MLSSTNFFFLWIKVFLIALKKFIFFLIQFCSHVFWTHIDNSTLMILQLMKYKLPFSAVMVRKKWIRNFFSENVMPEKKKPRKNVHHCQKEKLYEVILNLFKPCYYFSKICFVLILFLLFFIVYSKMHRCCYRIILWNYILKTNSYYPSF